MTSKTSSHPTRSLLTDLLTSHEYNDLTGAVTVNVCDALFAIATALNRVAAAQELNGARIEQRQQTALIIEALKDRLNDEEPHEGHA
jgi:chemotaxis regulatin CheY-phosphate phosphatase CheZ